MPFKLYETNSKSEIRNPKQIQMIQIRNSKPFAAFPVVIEKQGRFEYWDFEF
jgi:hypothetical protein